MPYPENEVIFQHDNDPQHTSKFVKNRLDKQKFKVLKWPSQRFDIKPSKNVLSYLKCKLINEYDSPPSNLDILWERAQQQGYKIPPAY